MAYKHKLNEKQRAFIRSYIKTFNATQSAINAGYSTRTADRIGSRLLKNVEVQSEIARHTKMIQTKSEITAERVLNELAKIAFSDLRDLVEWDESGVRLKDSSELENGVSRAVREVSETITMHGGSKSIKLYDKTKALELLGKNLKLFIERHEHTGADGGPIKVSDAPLTESEKAELELLRQKLVAVKSKS